MRLAAVGVGAAQPHRAAADAPAQRPHRRPRRPASSRGGSPRSRRTAAADHRPARDRGGRRGDAAPRSAPTSATGSPTTPTSPNHPSSRCTSTPTGGCGTRDGVTIRVAPTDHRPVEPTIGFRVEYDGASVVLAGDTVPCDEPRRAGRRRGRVGAHRDSQGPRRADAAAADPRHPRLPLVGRGGRRHRRPRRRRHPGAHPLRARHRARARRTSGARWPPRSSAARSNSATTCTGSRCTRACAPRRQASRVISTTTSRSVDPSPE